MFQSDSSTLQQIKERVLSGYHLSDIEELDCPTALLSKNVSVESLGRFRFRGTTRIDDFVRTPPATPALTNRRVTLLMLKT